LAVALALHSDSIKKKKIMKWFTVVALISLITFEVHSQSGWSPTRQVNISRARKPKAPADIVSLNLIKGIETFFENVIGDINASKSMSVDIPIEGIDDLESFDADAIRLLFNPHRHNAAEVAIADYEFAGNGEGRPALGQPIALTVTLQNIGQGNASNLEITFNNPENVFPAGETRFYIDELKPNETRSIVYEFFGNRKYDREEIPIEISITQNNQDARTRILSMPLEIKEGPVTIETTSVRSDVDVDIPVTRKASKNRYALIIGNEDYQKFQTGLQSDQNVLFARNDALVFKEYAIKTLGVSEKQTFLLTDATRGQMSREIERITELAKLSPNSEIIFYYAGHGLPDFETYQSYLMPVDVTASNLDDAINLRDLYSKFASSKASRIIVFLDACFSGGGRGENGLLAARTVKIRPKNDIVEGNIVAFTATSGKEVSLPFAEQSHGLFTYYLLKKLQETKGNVNLDELAQHLEQEIPKASLLENGTLQRPQVLVSPDLYDQWTAWKF
jgi:hypothetical protein